MILRQARCGTAQSYPSNKELSGDTCETGKYHTLVKYRDNVRRFCHHAEPAENKTMEEFAAYMQRRVVPDLLIFYHFLGFPTPYRLITAM